MWNTSQVWSDGATGMADPTNMFDPSSSKSTTVASRSSQGDIVFSQALTDVTKLEVKFTANIGNTHYIRINGTDQISDAGSGKDTWYDLTAALAGTGVFSSIGAKSAADGGPEIWAVRVDGEILVDGGSFGENGFHLPFDPAASIPPANYRDYMVANPITDSGSWDNPIYGFDGKLNTFYQASTTTQGNTLTMDLSPFFVGKDKQKIRVYTVHKGGSEQTITYKGGQSQTVLQNTWMEFDNTGDLGVIVMTQGAGTSAGNGFGFAAIEIDGEVLIDDSWIGSIGVDASGQDNHFHDQNFLVGKTDEVWSAGATQSNPDSADPTRQNISNLFDGDTSTLLAANDGNNASNLIQLTTSIPVASKVELYVVLGTPTGPYILAEDGTEIGRFESASPVNNGWVEVTGISEATSFNQITLTRDSSARGSGLALIRVDGELLIDANIQDTVLDTPMNNYAVLETGKNGNLVGTGAGSLVGTVKGDNWYCEVTPTAGTTNSDGNDVMHIQIFDENNSEVLVWRSNTGDTYTVGDVIGITIKDNKYQWYKNGSIVSKAGSSTDGPGSGTVSGTTFTPVFLNGGNNNAEAAFNFGQQPFVYADYNDDHTSTLKNTSPLYKENWSDDVAQADNPENAFDGDLTTSSYNRQNQGKSTITFDPPLEVKEKIRTYGDSNLIVFINGDERPPVGRDWQTHYFSGELANFKWSHDSGAKGQLGAIEIDGRILLDGNINNSQVWSDSVTGTSPVGYPVRQAFDGNVGTEGSVVNGEWFTFIPPGGIDGSELRVNANNVPLGYKIKINDGSEIEVLVDGDDAAPTWSETVAIPGGKLTKLEARRVSDADHGYRLWEVDGKILVDGQDLGPFDKLYQTWDQYATFGSFFYNENTDEIIQAFTLQRRYGLLSAKPEAGIYDLAVQPNFAVAAYVKEDNIYVPIENPEPRIAAAEAQAAAEVAAAEAEAEVQVAAAQAETRKYQKMLVRAACGWVLAKAYEAGDIIIYNGHVFRALEDNVATADNDPGDMEGTWEFIGLEEDAAPLALDGYFPLYETEEASNAAGNGYSHTHTIDGVTYYMPNGGVTIYHGNYTGFDY